MVNVNDECLVFYIFRLRTMTKSTGKIIKLDWKTPGFFCLLKEWEPCRPTQYYKYGGSDKIQW